MAAVLPGKFLYLCTPHTASLATVRALTEQLPGCSETVSPSGRHRYGYHHACRDEIGVPELFTWSVRREPRDVLVTCWLRYGRIRGCERTLGDFVREWADPPWVVDGRFDWHDVDEWVEYENLHDGVNALLARLGLPRVGIPQVNGTPGKGPWRGYWTAEAEDAFVERFGARGDGVGWPCASS